MLYKDFYAGAEMHCLGINLTGIEEIAEMSGSALIEKADAQVETLAYYAPWGDVVMFYGRFGSAAGLYELGHAISGSEYIRGMSGTIQIEKVSVPSGGVISGG